MEITQEKLRPLGIINLTKTGGQEGGYIINLGIGKKMVFDSDPKLREYLNKAGASFGAITRIDSEPITYKIESEKPLELKDLEFLKIIHLQGIEINLSIHGNLFIYEGVC